MAYQPGPGQTNPVSNRDEVFTQALELVRQVMRVDTDDPYDCMNRNLRRWSNCGFHLTLARSHLDNLRTTAKPAPGERDLLADAAIHALMALTLREAN
jgi:hypothetical protein